jgi:superfamily II DNA or RNA helicase
MTTNMAWNQYGKMLSSKPRPYQIEAIRSWFENSCRGVFEMATGTGKTFTAIAAVGFLIRQINGNKRSVLTIIVCPYIHVVDQWVSNLEKNNLKSLAAYESQAIWKNKLEDSVSDLQDLPGQSAIVVTTIATFKSKAFQTITNQMIGVEQIFVADEVHHFGAKSLSGFLGGKANYRLGLSATPERYLDPKGTSKIFDYFGKSVYKLDIKTAIEKDILCPYDYKPRVCRLTLEETLSYSDISEQIGLILKGREFYELSKQESEKVGKLLRLRSAVLGTCLDKQAIFFEDFKKNSHLKNQLVYCSQGSSPIHEQMGRHIEYVKELISVTGVRSETYEATTDRASRIRILSEFTAQELDVILSMKCLDEAVDIPSAKISYFLASGTNPREFIQRRGRVLRKDVGKTKAEIWDYIALPADIGNPEFLEFERQILSRELARAFELAEAADNSEEAKQVLEEIKIGK